MVTLAIHPGDFVGYPFWECIIVVKEEGTKSGAKDFLFISHLKMVVTEDKTPPLVCTFSSNIYAGCGRSKDLRLESRPCLLNNMP
jgi:hypothetical protein